MSQRSSFLSIAYGGARGFNRFSCSTRASLDIHKRGCCVLLRLCTVLRGRERETVFYVAVLYGLVFHLSPFHITPRGVRFTMIALNALLRVVSVNLGGRSGFTPSWTRAQLVPIVTRMSPPFIITMIYGNLPGCVKIMRIGRIYRNLTRMSWDVWDKISTTLPRGMRPMGCMVTYGISGQAGQAVFHDLARGKKI